MDALGSEQAFRKAAKKLGYKTNEIEAAVRDFDVFPIDDDDLMAIAGGIGGGPITNGTFTNDTEGLLNGTMNNSGSIGV